MLCRLGKKARHRQLKPLKHELFTESLIDDTPSSKSVLLDDTIFLEQLSMGSEWVDTQVRRLRTGSSNLYHKRYTCQCVVTQLAGR